MTHPLLAILLLMPLSALAQTQVPNVFEDGTPASAAEVNENFEYVLENASGGGGCSATQQDNSVVIECADGTSGVIAGAGTVVVYPEGQVGEVDPDVFQTGDVVLYDANNVLLGKVEYFNEYLGDVFYTIFISFSDIGSKRISLTDRVNQGSLQIDGLANRVNYQSTDCSGPAFLNTGTATGWVLDFGGGNFFAARNGAYQILYKSWRGTAGPDNGTMGECFSDEGLLSYAYLMVPVSLPPEILNAAYPVRLEQLP